MFDVLNSLKNIEAGHFTRRRKLPHSTLCNVHIWAEKSSHNRHFTCSVCFRAPWRQRTLMVWQALAMAYSSTIIILQCQDSIYSEHCISRNGLNTPILILRVYEWQHSHEYCHASTRNVDLHVADTSLSICTYDVTSFNVQSSTQQPQPAAP